MNETKILSVENYCSVSLKFSEYTCTGERNTLYLNQCERLSDVMVCMDHFVVILGKTQQSYMYLPPPKCMVNVMLGVL